MAQAKQNYIKSGLVLWMDGIDKGNVSGAWVDKVAGHVFNGINNPVFGDDHIQLNGTDQYLMCSTFTGDINSDNSTIEVVVDALKGIVFMPPAGNSVAFGFYGSGVIWSSASKRKYLLDLRVPFNGVVSLRDNLGITNGVNTTFTTTIDYCGQTNNNTYIGCRAGGDRLFQGKIYAIRIYNRQLTQSEMLHNQQIDNKRFNLGLSI